MPAAVAVPAAIAVGGAVMKGVSGARAANSARDAQLDAANRANQGLTDWRTQLQGQYQPYQDMGMQGTKTMAGLANNPSFWSGYGGFTPSWLQAAQQNQQSMSQQPQQGQGQQIQPVNQPDIPTQGGFGMQRLGNIMRTMQDGGMGQQGGMGQGGYSTQPMSSLGGKAGGSMQPMGLEGGMQGGAGPMPVGPGRGMGMPGAMEGGLQGGGGAMPVGPGRGMTDPYTGQGGGSLGQFGTSTEGPLQGGGGAMPVPGGQGGMGQGQGGFFPQPMVPGSDVGQAAGSGPNWGQAYGQSYQNQAAGMPGQINQNLANAYMSYDANTIMDDPGYEFQRDEGLKQVGQQMAAQGLSGSGAAVKEAGRYATGLANQAYDKAYGRFSQDRGFWAGRADQAFNQQMGLSNLGLGAQQQGFNQWLQGQGLGLQRDQFGRQITESDRNYNEVLRNAYLQQQSGLSNLGFNALNNYAQYGSGIQNQVGQNQLGQGNAQAASAMNNPWIGIGGSLAGVGGSMLGSNLANGGKWGG